MKKRLLFACKLLFESIYCIVGAFAMFIGASLLVNIKSAGLEGAGYFLFCLVSVCSVISGCSVMYFALNTISKTTKNYFEDDK